jgi:hypothetical protein
MLYEDFRFTCVFVFVCVFCHAILFLLEHYRYRINICLSSVFSELPSAHALHATLTGSINHFGESDNKVLPTSSALR